MAESPNRKFDSSDAPSVSIEIVVPTLNSHHLLPGLVASLQAQSWPHWRLWFIDGPSGPEHRAWLEQCCSNESRCCWLPQDPAETGIFGAMNQGFLLAPPDAWLLFWGSDDRAADAAVLAGAVARIETLRRDGADPDLLVCRGRYVHGGIPGRPSAFYWYHSYRCSMFLGSTPPHQATLIGPRARRRLARYEDDLRLSADLDYFLRLTGFSDLAVARSDQEFVHIEGGGISAVQTRRRLQEVRRAYRTAFGIAWPIPFVLRYIQRLLSLLA